MPGCAAYQWTKKDKFVYFLVMIPFLIAFIAAWSCWAGLQSSYLSL